MILSDITKILEEFAPIRYQESYDNSGLIVGDVNTDISGVLLCVDVTEDIILEAINKNINLIVSHHPLIFTGLKKISGSNSTERIVIEAIKHSIAIYACHTNLDSVKGGVSFKIGDILRLQGMRVLSPRGKLLSKIRIFTPKTHAEIVRSAMFTAGAGFIGDYDSCSYNIDGFGTFKANHGASPYVGEIGSVHQESEICIESIAENSIVSSVIESAKAVHPYQEMAFDVFRLDNKHLGIGLGVIGELISPISTVDFLHEIKSSLDVKSLRYTKIIKDNVQKIAICGGSGREALKDAISQGADIFISSDFKYHDFFEAEGRIIIVDIGHFESEQCTIDIFYDLITKKIPKFAVCKTEHSSNPINYL